MTAEWVKFSSGLLMAVIVAAIAAVGYGEVARERPVEALGEQLEAQLRAEAAPHIDLFDQIGGLNLHARDHFDRSVTQGSDAEIASHIDRFFPEFGDGTRRSIPELYDGFETETGASLEGVGAFLGDAASMTADQKRWFWAGFETVVDVTSEAGYRGSFYYFTPDRRMVMSAPEREDRLEFYRFNAPADFPLAGDEDPILFGEETNPDRVLQCTEISRYLSDETGDRSALACRVPLWSGETLQGAFGASFDVTDVLIGSTATPPPDGTAWLMTGGGQVLARNTNVREIGGTHDVADILAQIDPSASSGYFMSGTSVVAYVRLPYVDWMIVKCMPTGLVQNQVNLRALALFFILLIVGGALSAFVSGVARPARQTGVAVSAPPAE